MTAPHPNQPDGITPLPYEAGYVECDDWWNIDAEITTVAREIADGPTADYIVRACNAFPAMLAALKKVDAYFKACGAAWAANQGVMIDKETRRATVEADGLDQLCDKADEATRAAIALATGGAK